MNMIMYILYRVVYRPWGIGHPVRFIQLGNHVKIAIGYKYNRSYRM